ncbi:hypothetical protein RchiOBHm_Chr2g0144201 [Rosa chinensis]|uniref:Uncharacterized protein n=1 Tax=Rosa chinensis TaxID=74649 RepID=A0A2P6RYB1_ROSCH|nr:hypothetical protein RchiOBHm_Chr2g0144201 [Rosa chinensis]
MLHIKHLSSVDDIVVFWPRPILWQTHPINLCFLGFFVGFFLGRSTSVRGVCVV